MILLTFFFIRQKPLSFHRIHLVNFLIAWLWHFGLALVAKHQGQDKFDGPKKCIDPKNHSICAYFCKSTRGEKHLHYPTTDDSPKCCTSIAEEGVPCKYIATNLGRCELSQSGFLDGTEGANFVPTAILSALLLSVIDGSIHLGLITPNMLAATRIQ